MTIPQARLEAFLEPFREHAPLAARVRIVLNGLPEDVIRDFTDDPNFRIALDDFVAGRGRIVWLAGFTALVSESRSVVLKPGLAHCSESFACYVIAHEFAHAFLRNGSWKEFHDREDAADALAASWGFPPQPWEF